MSIRKFHFAPQNNLDLDGKGGDLRAIRIQQSKKRKRVNDEPEQITLSSDDEDNDEGRMSSFMNHESSFSASKSNLSQFSANVTRFATEFAKICPKPESKSVKLDYNEPSSGRRG